MVIPKLEDVHCATTWSGANNSVFLFSIPLLLSFPYSRPQCHTSPPRKRKVSSLRASRRLPASRKPRRSRNTFAVRISRSLYFILFYRLVRSTKLAYDCSSLQNASSTLGITVPPLLSGTFLKSSLYCPTRFRPSRLSSPSTRSSRMVILTQVLPAPRPLSETDST